MVLGREIAMRYFHSRPGGPAPGRRGFTLLELIVVITIIGILGTLVTIKVIPILIDTRTTTVKTNLETIVRAAKIVQVRTGSFPATLEELVSARPEEGLLDTVPIDPWKRPYLYELRDGVPTAICLGRDGAEGGEGEDADHIHPDPGVR
jgi:general secretion pathway protein G